MDQKEFESFIRQEFLGEAKELVERLEELLIELEKDPKPSTIDGIFRVAHTLKGSGATAGYETVGKVAHEFETVLNEVRDGTRQVDESLISVFLGITDAFTQFISSEDTQPGEYDIGSHPACQGLSKLKSGLAEAPKSKDIQANVPAKNGAKFNRVLVVDDEEEIREIMSELMGDFSNSVEVADDGDVALKMVRQSTYDLVITDIYMPKMSGLVFVEKLRELHRSLPVIFFSGAATREDLLAIVDLGGVDFWSKPLNMDLVEVSLKNAAMFRDTRDLIGKLSALNYRAYVDTLRITAVIDSQDPMLANIKERLDKTLKEISALTHKLLRTEEEDKAA